MSPFRLTVVCGNPRAGSRTLGTAVDVATRIQGSVGDGSGWDVQTVDLAEIADELFAPDHPRVDAALDRLAGSDVVVVASPTYNASYTGLLKAFLDLLPHRALTGVVAVPVMVMGAPVHALAADLHLRPLLLELGAGLPTASVVLTEDALGGAALDDWAAANASTVVDLATARRTPLREHVPA